VPEQAAHVYELGLGAAHLFQRHPREPVKLKDDFRVSYT
jgi:hypothetical protein